MTSDKLLVSPHEVFETEKWVVRTESISRTDGAAEDGSCYGIGIVITWWEGDISEEGLKRSPISLFTPAVTKKSAEAKLCMNDMAAGR